VPENRDLDISVFGPNLNTDLETGNRKYRYRDSVPIPNIYLFICPPTVPGRSQQ
jgi:hypothetical protein